MTIKKFIYSAQQSLQVSTGNDFKRGHIYELLAASFNFNSYAALSSEAVFTLQQDGEKHLSQNNTSILKRCNELGYSLETAGIASTRLQELVNEHQIDCITISDLIDSLRSDYSIGDDYPDWIIGELPQILLDCLEVAANKNNAHAHFALALINVTGEPKSGHDYWYLEEQNGRVLSGVEKEWADEYKTLIAKSKKFSLHLKEAARLGNREALLDMAEHFDDPSFFETVNVSVDDDPIRVAEIAERLGRTKDMRRWLVVAAEQGDVEAIQRLIEEFDDFDLQQKWTWVYLAQLMGTDLTVSDHYAIHEDGSIYDDDVGGPMYVDGRDALEIKSLDEDQAIAAKTAARELFERIQQTEATGA
ncbi:MAG: hypothetical protein ABL933_02735 [Methyloglobulus sp.]|nr:hypothetical protein [Methyloglobulus sp.]